jgi:hypothetical protein
MILLDLKSEAIAFGDERLIDASNSPSHQVLLNMKSSSVIESSIKKSLARKNSGCK